MTSKSKFIRLADELLERENRFIDISKTNSSVFVVEIEKAELKRLWESVLEEYNTVMDSTRVTEEVKEEVKAKYIECYDAYVISGASLSEYVAASIIEPDLKSSAAQMQPIEAAAAESQATIPGAAPAVKAPEHTPTTNIVVEAPVMGFHTQLPPCDTELFHGDYHSWPSFRDLFHAIYISDPRVPPVRCLYYLIQKCRGEALDIVKKFPLTNEGFNSAWQGLAQRFENKRVLVNSQLKVLFNLSPINHESGSAIKELHRSISNIRAALDAYKIDISNWDAIFIYICSMKLPEVTLSLWEQSLPDSTEIPKWSDLDSFLRKRFQSLETVTDMRAAGPRPTLVRSNPQFSNPRSQRLATFHSNVQSQGCGLCNERHHILRTCRRFARLPCGERLDTVKRLGFCSRCLANTHEIKDCRSRHTCSKCKGNHHTLLHQDANVSSSYRGTEEEEASTSAQALGNVASHFASNSRNVLLGTAQVLISHDGVSYSARALIDPGSEASFISQRLQRQLRIPTFPVSAQVSGLNNATSGKVEKMCKLSIGSARQEDFECKATCLVLPSLTGNLPSHTLSDTLSCEDLDIQLADKGWKESTPVDVLIGGDIYPEVILTGIKKNVLGSLLAQETVFGWILTGPLEAKSSPPLRKIVTFFNEVSLDKQLARFWELEDVPVKNFLTEEESFCETLYSETTIRKNTGRYEVRLPFRPNADKTTLNGSKEVARNIFIRNETRLMKSPASKTEYDRVLKEYIELGHMKEIKGNGEMGYFLPHHAVIKPESTTTKIRVVFNASSRARSGTSLNDLLFPGPTLQADLMKLILQWRFFQYVFNGDIEKMYRQISVHPSDTPYQRILFREDRDENLKEYELQTVTFGVNCAPYLAIRTLLRLATDVEGQFPLAASILRSSMYVDDALVGAHDLETAIRSRDELRVALKSAGLTMRKWTANTQKLLEDLDKADLLSEDFLRFEDSSSAKTLGIRWNAQSDIFYFKANAVEVKESYTKRQILSGIAQLFDPAGWLSPIIIRAKILMQTIWLQKTNWDEPVKADSLEEWKNFLSNYDMINQITIPRWIRFSPYVAVQFHAFCDASEKAYGACIYVRVEVEGTTLCNLLCAKSRVAPVKSVSLPRLELCGASLLADMVESLDNLKIDKAKLFCWTDSTIVLAWLNKPPCTWKVFVANRVAKIKDHIGLASWFHVDSQDNPADLVSRGVAAPDLVYNSLWWHGPEWLIQPPEQWPASKNNMETELEQRPIRVNFAASQPEEDLLVRFSSYKRCIRVMAYVVRFIKGCRKESRPIALYIDGAEFNEVKRRLIILTQRRYYSEEYDTLEKRRSIASKSSLLSLNPFLDESKLLRVGGRLNFAPSLTFGERHPVILPYESVLARLLVTFAHHHTHHGGNDLMLRYLRSEFWIIKVKNMIRNVVRNCKVCVIHRRETKQQIMSSLPADRLEISRPFATTGVDFCGPFDIKSYAGRGCKITKGYVCLFICFATKAIHLELTSDLSTGTFLEAFSRFISRRGCPNKIYSDNGTNFVGASKELKREFVQYMKQIKETCEIKHSDQQVEWKFIPPGAPHMGGLWESGVKSFKKHFRRVVGEYKMTFEEFSTLIYRIESCLNSRPISSQSNDPDDLAPLTPGHFLVGGPLLSLCEAEEDCSKTTYASRWRKVKAMIQEVCRRWKVEYLAELQKRYKWQRASEDLKINDLVVITQENVAPKEWRLGRILQVHPGKDGLVRVATIKTARGPVTRPITKLVLLPTN